MRRGAGIWVVVSLLLTLLAGPPAASAGAQTDARVEPPAATAVHHRVLLAYVTNRGAWSTTPEQIADAVDGALERWREVVPRAFLSLERVGDPVAYAASAMPSPESRCGLRYERPNELAASLAEARASMGVAPVPGVVDHLVVVVPLACTPGFAMGHTGFVASLDAGGGSIISEQRTGVSPTLQDHVFEEIGHSLSLGGADLGCPPGVESCMTWFRGDCWSPMARGQSGAQLSTAHLAAAGILQPGELASVNTDLGPADQLVTLRPRGESEGLRGIEVTDPETGRTYYVDYRSGTGADATVPPSNPPCPTGVAITELLPRRSTVLVPKVLKDMTNIGHDGITWAAGDSATLSSSLSVDVLAVDPVLGATVRVRAADPPRFGRVPKAELTGRVAGEHVGVSLGTFRPAPTRLVHRWYLNGVLVRGADGSLTETESLLLGKPGDRLVGEVVAIRPGRRRAVVRTPSVSLVRGLRIRQVRLVGELRVGHRLTVRFERPRNPKHLKVRYVWRVGGVKLSVPGKRLVLTPAMAHKRVQVTVIARAPGYEKVTITVARPQTVRP